jgi:hypothetical protein
MNPTPAPIPEDFGNPWMANLTEIGLPDPVPWWPPAPGWYVVAGLLVLGLLWQAWRLLHRWQANAYRREALSELRDIEASGVDALVRLPALLKRSALSAYPRAAVASLSGDAWLGFLDGCLGTTDFTRGPGRPLAELAYDPAAAARLSGSDVRSLVRLAQRWVRRHQRVSP